MEETANRKSVAGSAEACSSASKVTGRVQSFLVWSIILLAAAVMAGCSKNGAESSVISEGAEGGTGTDKQLYQCSMHPNIISDEPGTCPICAMDLQLVQQIKAKGIPGRSPVDLTGQQQQLINIRLAPAIKREATKIIRGVGIITYDETKVVDVNSKVMGWVDQLYVDKPGQFVEANEPLMALYSPDLYSAQQEYLLAFQQFQRMNGKTSATAEGQFQQFLLEGESLLESARKRFELWDISDEQIEALEKSGKPRNTLKLTASISGFVMEKNVFPKQMIQPGMQLYRLADLSQVWMDVEVYEYELPLLKKGQTVNIHLVSDSRLSFEGKVDFIYPYLEDKTRTAKVRLLMENSNFQLRPGMYANAEIHVDLGVQLLVPETAVFDTGKQEYVFVKQSEGIFVPMLVNLGPKAKDHFVIQDGIKEGDEVVIDGNFLLDSESQLKAAASGPAEDTPPEDEFTGMVPEPISLPDKAEALFSPAIDNYLRMADLLAQDTLEGLDDLAEQIRSQVEAIQASALRPSSEVDLYETELQELDTALAKFSAPDAETARTQFGEVSAVLISLVSSFLPPLEQTLHVARCPMWEKSPGLWIQTETEIKNPFMGQKMPSCGEIVDQVGGDQ